MRFYRKETVYEAALDRIRRLYDEFEEVWVSYSGGKDSTVIYELTKIVARERGRLPVKVVFLDQEAEYQATDDIVRKMMYDPDVDPYWLQIPIKLFNATSNENDWLNCWEPGDTWLREKDPISKKENVWGTDRFADFFMKFLDVEAKGKLHCAVTGVRGEESPNRLTGLTYYETYKGITWGKKNPYNTNTFNFHPLYDWSYLDVWKAIHDNGWEYNKVYDYQYSLGVSVSDMRVSNLHHETAVKNLFVLQEIEPETYQKLAARVDGIDTAAKLGAEDYYVRTLPYMFKDWVEYRDYLLENLITNPDHKKKFRKIFDTTQKRYERYVGADPIAKAHIQSLLANDYHGTKIGNAMGRWKMKMRDQKRREARDEMAKRAVEEQ